MTDTPNPGLATELTPHPEKQLVYSSPSIHERRSRILREARKLLAEGGLEKFSIRTLCKRADVAQRTLYNAFHNRDRIMALAIREAYEDVNRYMRYRTSAETLDGIIDRLISVNSRNLRARNYTQAVATIFFSGAASHDIWVAMREMVDINLRQWLNRLVRENLLEDWVNVGELADEIANLEYATINDWAQGRIPDEDYVRRLITSVLTHMAGALKGEERELATAMLRRIRATGELPEFPKPVYTPRRKEEAA
ncbi:MAG: TetR/AcrR family transcriptional regulator [Sphingomonadales bacterium]|nr:TetR/AcrR family transcriptional regulator [Sphingomonadales bacterium]